MRNLFYTLLISTLAYSTTVLSVELPSPVVSAEWLKSNLADVVVLDFRSDPSGFTSTPVYDNVDGKSSLTELGGHIQGARLADFNQWRVSRTIDGKKIDKLVPDEQTVTRLMQALGVNATDVLVLTVPGESYDEVDMATRAYWTLKSYGHRRMAVLDGGNAAWGQAGYALVSSPVPTYGAGDWTAAQFDKTWFADKSDVKTASEQGDVEIIDARPLPQYLGITFKAPSVTAPGHVKGARNFAPELQVVSSGIAQVFLPASHYSDVLAAVSIETHASNSIVYCNTGHLASGAWFVMSEIMQVEGVKLYDGSMHEWTTLGNAVVSNVRSTK